MPIEWIEVYWLKGGLRTLRLLFLYGKASV